MWKMLTKSVSANIISYHTVFLNQLCYIVAGTELDDKDIVEVVKGKIGSSF